MVGALATIQTLKIKYGGIHPETYGAGFFNACTAKGLKRLELVEKQELVMVLEVIKNCQ